MNNRDDHEAIYQELVSLLGIKFKTALKGTDITFKHLYKIQDMITSHHDYLVTFEHPKAFRFSGLADFLSQMIDMVQNAIALLDDEFKSLQLRSQEDLILDEYEMFNRHEYIGYTGERLVKFLAVLRGLLKKHAALEDDALPTKD